MSLEQTQQTIDHYFDVMTRGGDFAVYYTDDVTWTMTDTGDEVRGASSVRDYIVALHTTCSMHVRQRSSSPTGTHI
jgi:hypothetical protein